MNSQSLLHPSQDMLLLAGWVFADLLLGLTVLFLAAAPGGQIAQPSPSTITPCPIVLETQSHIEDFRLDLASVVQGGLARQQQLASFQNLVRQRLGGAPRAGFVLVYGYAPNNAEGVVQGRLLASEVSRVLPQALPTVFGDASYEPLFWLIGSGDTEQPGTVRLKTFFFRSCP